ncbi:hypothetical protein BH23GEM9_BH23GEM9_05190 [soil metagenome]
MWPAYLKGISSSFPDASITFDKFHVMKLLNVAADTVRRAEQRLRPELKGSRYEWTKNPENINPHQFALWDALDIKRPNLKQPERCARGWHPSSVPRA